MPAKTKRPYAKLFFNTLVISACAFGGGFVVIPMLRRKFVQQLGWVSEEDLFNLMAIAQCTPGTIAGNCNLLVGYRACGVPGAVLCMLAMMLPPFLILMVLTSFYGAFKDLPSVRHLMRGMQAGVGAVIVQISYDMIRTVLKKDKSPVFILAAIAGFAGVFFFGLSPFLFIAGGAAAGLLVFAWRRQKEGL